MSQHTPGPWRVVHEPLNPNPRVLSANNRLVVVVSQGPVFAKETTANARLIAAAPELLEACKAFCRECEAFDGALPDPCVALWLDVVRAAIAKAEGGAP